jgi:hypothetical protein
MTVTFWSVVILLTSFLSACQQGDAKRPQDRKMQEQQQKLDMAIQKLEGDADKVIQQGEQVYRDVMRSAQQFSDEFEKQAQGIVRSAEQLAQEAQKIQRLPETLQQKSGGIVQAAQTAIGQVRGNPEGPAKQEESSEPKPFDP